MSLAAYALAVRNHLRTNLTSFYNNVVPEQQAANRALNCRITQDDRPTPQSGQEFISIRGVSWQPGPLRLMQAVEERFAVTIAITHRVAFMPFDYRGEANYLRDEDKFTLAQVSLESRCREIIRLLEKNYTVMQAANALFDADNGFSEPLIWTGCDAEPQIVDADHFTATHDPTGKLLDDEQYGLLMRIRFGEAVRFQPLSVFDLDT
jgi:hypothetical protein